MTVRSSCIASDCAGAVGVSVPSLRQLRPVILPIATAGAVLLLWQALCAVARIPHVIDLPAPSGLPARLAPLADVSLKEAVPTTLDSLVAFAIATTLGVGLAVALTYSPLIRDTLYPNLVAFQLIPKSRPGAALCRLARHHQRVTHRVLHLCLLLSGGDLGCRRLRRRRRLDLAPLPVANGFRLAEFSFGAVSVRPAGDLQRDEDRDDDGDYRRDHWRIHLGQGLELSLSLRQLAHAGYGGDLRGAVCPRH